MAHICVMPLFLNESVEQKDKVDACDCTLSGCDSLCFRFPHTEAPKKTLSILDIQLRLDDF